jgi:hypothetical protein
MSAARHVKNSALRLSLPHAVGQLKLQKSNIHVAGLSSLPLFDSLHLSRSTA